MKKIAVCHTINPNSKTSGLFKHPLPYYYTATCFLHFTPICFCFILQASSWTSIVHTSKSLAVCLTHPITIAFHVGLYATSRTVVVFGTLLIAWIYKLWIKISLHLHCTKHFIFIFKFSNCQKKVNGTNNINTKAWNMYIFMCFLSSSWS
jgi:hypothetical protein